MLSFFSTVALHGNPVAPLPAATTMRPTSSVLAEDRAQLTPGCGKSGLVSWGSVESRLNACFKASCFLPAGYWRRRRGNLESSMVPGQFNIDAGLARSAPVSCAQRSGSVQFRAEFFNALNHPQFANPNTTFGSSSFRLISSTAVSPRVGQQAIKMTF